MENEGELTNELVLLHGCFRSKRFVLYFCYHGRRGFIRGRQVGIARLATCGKFASRQVMFYTRTVAGGLSFSVVKLVDHWDLRYAVYRIAPRVWIHQWTLCENARIQPIPSQKGPAFQIKDLVKESQRTLVDT